MNEGVLGTIFAFAGSLVGSDFFQLTHRGLDLMALFLRHGTYRQAAARVLSSSYMDQSPLGKLMIIDTIPVIREFDEPLADALRNMVLRDNNVNVRAYLEERERGQ